jgi:PAS domain S-box-containing protein
MRAEKFSATAKNWVVGGGELGALLGDSFGDALRSHNWSQTPLGAVETWSDDLKTAVQILLTELNRAQPPEKTQRDFEERQDAAAALHQANQLNAFRVKLAEALRPLTDASEIQAIAARILGEFLGASRVIYVEVVPAGEEVIVHCNYTSGVAQLSGRYRLEDYQRNLTADYQAGHSQVVTEIPHNPNYTDAEKARYREIEIAAHIDVPLLKNNQFVALLAVHQSTPRQWTETEVKLAEETAERTWAAVERAYAEAALRESEAKYRTLFESIDEGFCICELLFDEKGEPHNYRFLEVNSVFERLTGLGQAAGKTIQELVPNFEADWFEIYGRLVQTREPVRFEQQSLAMNRWFSVNAFCIGEPQSHQFAILFTNITEAKRAEVVRKHAETALQASEAQIRNILESITDGFYALDQDWRFTYVNPQAERILDLTPGDLLGQVVWEAYPGAVGSEFERAYRRTASEGVASSVISFYPDHNRWYEIYAYPAADGITVYFRDITEKIQAEVALRESEEKTRNILESIAEAFFALDENWRFTYMNQSGEALLDRRDLIGKDFWQEYPGVAGNAFEQVYRKAMDDRVPGTLTAFYPDHDRWYDIRTYPAANGIAVYFNNVTEQIQAEVALRQSEERYRTLFESLDEGFCTIEVLFDADGKPFDYRFLEVNPAFEQQTGIDNAIGRTMREFAPQHEEFWFEIYGRIALTGEAQRFEHRAASLDRLYDVYAFRIGDAVARQVAILFNDISDRKRAEEALRESEEQQAFLLKFSDVLRAEPDADAVANRAIRMLSEQMQLDRCYIGVYRLADDRGDFTHQVGNDRVPPLPDGVRLSDFPESLRVASDRTLVINDIAELEGLIDTDRQSLSGLGLRALVAATLRKGENNPLWSIVSVSAHPRRWTRGEIALVEEVAERTWAAMERARAEAIVAADFQDTQRLRELGVRLVTEDDIQTLYQAILSTAIDLTQADAGTVQILDVATQYLVLLATQGFKETIITHFDRVSESDNTPCGMALKTGNRSTVDFDVPESENPDGSWRLLMEAGYRTGQSTPLITRAGKIIGMVSTHWREHHRPSDRELRFLDLLARQAADLIEQRQTAAEREKLLACEQAARAEADRANRVKDEFLAVLSHELRSPLNPILGWTQLLQNGKLNEARRAEALKTIERNVKLQAQLIEDLLDISRIMQGKLSLTEAPVSLTFVISAALETVRLAAEAKHIRIQLDLDNTVAPISGDAARLQQVVWNLLSNAVKFTPNGGQVTIELRQLNQQAQIRVIDTGKGINSQFLPYMFEFFRQEDGSTTRKFGGLGLGLAIARQIVEMHGGTVRAESQGERQGATFIVQLPAMKQTALIVSEPVQTKTDTGLPLEGIHILLVDDEPDTREFQGFLLEQSGAKVTAVASGLEALQALEQSIPDLLVSDIGMADMDGYMLLQQIRSRSANQGGMIPAIALTAYAAQMDQHRALQVGFQTHITKPVEPEVLVKAIAVLLQGGEQKISGEIDDNSAGFGVK